MIKRFAHYYKPHLKIFIADMCCAFLVAGCNMFYPMLTRSIINDYVPNRNLRFILIAAGALLGIYLLKAALNYFIQYYGHIMGVRIQVDIRRDAFEHLQKLPFSYFDRTKSGTIMSRVINDTFEISELAHHGPEDLFISIITLIGSFTLLSTINIKLTLIIFAFIPLLVWFSVRMRVRLAQTSLQTRVEIAEVNADLENSIAGVRVSKAYESSDHELEKFQSGSESYAHAQGLRYQAMAQFFSGTGLIMDILMLVTVVAGGLFTYYGQINIGDFTAYLLFVNLFTDPIKRLINFIEQLQAGMTGFSRIMELIDVKPEGEDPDAKPLTEVKGDIRFDDITFRYDEGKSVLSHVSLDIQSGETVALVGPSGGGKSTLCHLLPRFYDLDKGAILLDGTDIRKFTRDSLRRKIGIVQQDTFLFTGSIRDNITYGNFDATEEEIIRAAKNAEIHDFIETLPDKYDTFIGERGVMLSGGQKQRISIARIFLKNPPILILDEATSALDNTTEVAIQAALDGLSRGRTTLIVAHRLSTIRGADKIVVIADRGIIESGSHGELLEKNGLYARLWDAQKMPE
ncbi:ABC transporter ATP-binding protein/permease [Ruminococcaceae bacterium OttesenSCG-928-L11]|nr:ABC transporter ATP-binding protein/permease [Ruminococcaceae bacterium OttesenSCG-928-L11]